MVINESVESNAKNRIETLTDDSGNSFSSHADKIKKSETALHEVRL